jgi:tryptophanyl-tRNA synthetase
MNIDSAFPFRIVSGFRPLRGLHIGHDAAVLADIRKYQYVSKGSTFVFIADHHARSRWDERVDFLNIRQRSTEIAKQLIACGIDPDFCVIYRQSDVPELFEFMWFLAGVVPDSSLKRGHAVANAIGPSVGMYLYPLLMVSDILSLRATNVAIGRDQKQHLELARNVARRLIKRFGADIIPIPDPLSAEPILVNGIDSSIEKPKKMDVETKNDIPLFADEETIEDRIAETVTQTVQWGKPLPTEGCNILSFARCIGGIEFENQLIDRYGSGQFGYSDAKNHLREMFFENYGPFRSRYQQISDKDVNEILSLGGKRARQTIAPLIFEIRSAMSTSL